jgi:hypothetical protein
MGQNCGCEFDVNEVELQFDKSVSLGSPHYSC